MKTSLFFASLMLLSLICCNNEDKTGDTQNESGIASVDAGVDQSSENIVGKWKKAEYGMDNNKNGVLDPSEIEKDPDVGAFENFTFYPGGRFMYSGISGEMKGDYSVKNVNGKKMILLMEDDPEYEGMSREEREQEATRFEIKSKSANKMVLVPPIYSFLLVAYTKTN